MIQLRNRHFLAADALLLVAAATLAFVARYETTALPTDLVRVLVVYVALTIPTRLVVLYRFGVYARLWRYAGQGDFELLGAASLASAAVGMAVGLAVLPLADVGLTRAPFSALALDGLLGGLAFAVPRLLMRRRAVPRQGGARRALVVGAGAAGSSIVREIREHGQLNLLPVAFVDDDPAKCHRKLQGVPVVGTVEQIPDVVRRHGIDEVVIAMPSSPGAAVRRVLSLALAAGVPTRTVPGLFEIISGAKSVSALRSVEIADLLQREPVQTDLERVSALAHDKVVLVTGAGGSIGSELCRQIARLRPSRLIAVGRGENSIFELVQELSRLAPDLAIDPVIADVRDRSRLERVFRAARPHTVFHAAAHKHVPLMEQNVSEAILNNVLGTHVVGELSARYGVERFVLISSDKAVRPSSVMGATKRIAEGVLQEIGARSTCQFVAVRFGNVLGSRGSVIPTFLRQIQAGGPVTITHPDMVRYFMTIPEAVQLVLQAGVMGTGGEVFVLDMGQPVRVLDLAKDLIRLSGLGEDDVEIRYTGMRPGEKLYEELFFNEENASPTEHPKVLRARNARLELDAGVSVAGLVALAQRNAPADELRRALKALVPEYTGAPDEPPRPARPVIEPSVDAVAAGYARAH